MFTALLGGVGGAKLAVGLARQLPPDALTLIVNTADDLEWHGLYISPDIDSVLYALAGRADEASGWGIAGDTTHALEGLAEFGFEPWFRVGDRDLATHIARTEWLNAGQRYTEVVGRLAQGLGVATRVLPMSDEPVRTKVHTARGVLDFQEYFVRRQADAEVTAFSFAGAGVAFPTLEAMAALQEAEGIIIAPSNPFVSIGAILALPEIRQELGRTRIPVVAVSPIVGGRAVKGPADRMLRELGYDATAQAVAGLYADFLDGFVVDCADAEQAPAIEALGIRVHVTNTLMRTLEDKVRLAGETLDLARVLGPAPK